MTRVDPNAPALSVVIPCYNGEATIGGAVESALVLGQRYNVDVVVADDGSTDSTGRVLQSMKARNRNTLRSIRLHRGEASNRSRARNAGARETRGEWLLFLDCSLRLPRTFIDNLTLEASTVLLAFYPPRDNPLLCKPRHAPLDAALADPRYGFAEATAGVLSRLLCPWLLGWSGVLLVPRTLFELVGGFDETFVGWGAEDVEFCYRLHGAGANFRFAGSDCATRQQGPVSDDLRSRGISLRKNLERFHSIHGSLETEVLLGLPQLFAGSFLERLNRLPMRYAVPDYEPEVLDFIKEKLRAATTLVAGASQELVSLGAKIALVPNETAKQALEKAFPHCLVERSLGARLNLRSGEIDFALVTDLIMMMPASLQTEIFRELSRVANSVLLLCTKRDSPHSIFYGRPAFRQASGWTLLPVEVIRRIAASIGQHVKPVYQTRYLVILNLTQV